MMTNLNLIKHLKTSNRNLDIQVSTILEICLEMEVIHGAEEEANLMEQLNTLWILLTNMLTNTKMTKRQKKKAKLVMDVTEGLEDSVMRDRNGVKKEQSS